MTESVERPQGGVEAELLASVPGAGIDGPACVLPSELSDRYRYLGDVEVGLDPEGVAVDLRTGLAYVACSRSDAVRVVDPDSRAAVATVPVGREPIDIAIDPVTARAFTADARSDQVSVIDLDTHRVVATVPVGAYPAGLDLDVARRRLFCGDTMGSTVTAIDLDELRPLFTVPAELGAGAVGVDRQRGLLYCINFIGASMTVIDATGDGGPDAVVARVPLGEGACAVAVNPTRPEVYAVNSLVGTISRVDTRTFEVLDELPAPHAPVGLAAGPRGDRLYVTNRGDGSVSVLGLDGAEWSRIPVGTAPGGVVIPYPDRPGVALVANAGTGSLTIVEDLLDGPPPAAPPFPPHPLVGRRLPEFRLPDTEGRMRDSVEWAEKRYILSFFASW